MHSEAEIRSALLRLFQAGLDSARPEAVVAAHLPARPAGRCIVVGAGKASAAMAKAVEDAWPDADLSGIVITRYGHAVPTRRVEIVEAAHPVPDASGLAATARMLDMLRGLGPDDLVLALISGGGSSLLVAPVEGVTLGEKQEVSRRLLASGAPISDMNVVRSHLSQVKGGRLAEAAHPARLITLVLSDVPGDDPAIIASGPTLPHTSRRSDALNILRQYEIDPPVSVLKHLSEAETAERFATVPDIRMVATPRVALLRMAEEARAMGISPLILGDALEGDARGMGTVLGGIARSVAEHGSPLPRPAVLLSGGEATVTIGPDPGRGGRNTEFLLACALATKDMPGIHAIACDSDGIDGTEDVAGAIFLAGSLARGQAAGLDPKAVLSRHDSYAWFDALKDLVRTGPTLTNVNDLRAIIIL